MNDSIEILDRLKTAGLRPTRQRLTLARLLFREGDRHVTAEQLHGEALALEWIEDAVDAPAATPARATTITQPPTAAQDPAAPPRAVLLDLMAALDLGHVKAIRRTIEVLQAEAPDASRFVGRLQALSRDFEFDTMRQLVAEALDGA